MSDQKPSLRIGADLGVITTENGESVHRGQIPHLLTLEDATSHQLLSQLTPTHWREAAQKYPELIPSIRELNPGLDLVPPTVDQTAE